ncbi:MAG TPA: enoyl-CoA hydratase-related protein, partial [Euzebya sp.]|nr:enoyl-CoA hydratase-related protein [Euzebya sp.]
MSDGATSGPPIPAAPSPGHHADGYQTLTYAVTDRVCRITLDRPDRGNALTARLITELAAAVEQADLDPAVHVILLSGNGKGFCGGYDLVEAAETQLDLGEGLVPAPPGSALDPAVMA